MSTLMKSQSMSENFPLVVTVNEDDSITIEWDENHPVTSVFNTWTEKDFLDSILNGCKDVIGEEEYDRIKKEHLPRE
jgi:hypothetical protein